MELEDGEATKRDTTMTFTTFVLFDLFNALACRHNSRPVYELMWNSNTAFLAAVFLSIVGQLLVIYLEPLQKVFRTVSLSVNDIVFIVILSSTMLLLDTIRKKCFPAIFTESRTSGGDNISFNFASLVSVGSSSASKKRDNADEDESPDDIALKSPLIV